MKNKKMNRIVSLLLAAVMILTLTFALASCKNKDEDAPVTAEAKLSNYISFKDPARNELEKLTDLTKDLGQLGNSYEEFAMFWKSDRDALNNITNTISLYSLKDKKILFTVSDTYANELGEDEFGNEFKPEKMLVDAILTNTNGIPYVVLVYVEYTRISDEVIKENAEFVEDASGSYFDYGPSYSETTYFEFYDVTGKFINKSYTTYEATGLSEKKITDKHTILSFGKIAAIFNTATYELVETIDADVNGMPTLYDYVNDEYNYLLNVPTEHFAEQSGTPLGVGYSVEVYNKKDKLVCSYPYGAKNLMSKAHVLDSGDVLINHADFDAETGNARYSSFILDVETGKVTELKNLNYRVIQVITRDLFNEMAADTGISFTDNARNVIIAANENNEMVIIFMDNFGNVNYVFDNRLTYDAEAHGLSVKIYDDNHIFVEAAVVDAKGIMLAPDGTVIAYVPKDAIIVGDHIIVDNKVYDLDMKFVRELNGTWRDAFLDTYVSDPDNDDDDDEPMKDENYDDNLTSHGYFGNYAVYGYSHIAYDETDTDITKKGVLLYNIKNENITRYEGYEYNNILGGELLVIKSPSTSIYKVINTEGACLFTFEANSYDHCAVDTGVIITFDTDNGYLTVLIDEAAEEGGTN